MLPRVPVTSLLVRRHIKALCRPILNLGYSVIRVLFQFGLGYGECRACGSYQPVT